MGNRNLYSNKIDSAYGKKMREEERKQGRVAKKRLRDFTKITPAGKKTQWYY